jgi:hypothetical protein
MIGSNQYASRWAGFSGPFGGILVIPKIEKSALCWLYSDPHHQIFLVLTSTTNGSLVGAFPHCR